jgi:ankyrin repeat protein
MSTGAGYLEMMELLLDAGAEVNAGSEYGLTALSVAYFHGFGRAAAMLLERGTDVETSDMIGRTVLSRLACRGNVKVTAALLEDADRLGLVSSYN